ncbi:MAG: hypothetical protein EXR79_04905 [Myxococcales bacterium]|nr:hypothetical protein [Myxococcales bacterium]
MPFDERTMPFDERTMPFDERTMPFDERSAVPRVPLALRAYLASIENCFIALRGRGIQWSHDDGARARSWFDVGVPAGAVVRVIEARVRAWEFSHGRASSVPASLRWYDPAVLDHTRHLRRVGHTEGHACESTGVPADADITLGHLVDMAADLARSAPAPIAAHAYRAGFAALDRRLHGSDAEDATPPDLDAVVDRARAAVVKAALGGLPDAERAALEADIEEQLRPLRATLSRKALQARGRLLLEARISAHLGLRLPTRAGWKEPDDLA